MTYQYNNYEFSAFSEASLLAQGGNGTSFGCGDTFTMPAYADTKIVVNDNDGKLSGDGYYNDHATDHYGQTASITTNGSSVGTGGQVFAEQYLWVYDQHGNWYVMVEVEQEGTGADFFTFYTDGHYTLPPEGAHLTVHSTCNVTSEWIGYNNLGAGDAHVPPAVPDVWEFDTDTCTYTIEAEDLDLHNFQTVHGYHASGGELVKITGHEGKLSTDFGGETGTYNLKLHVQDECDGHSTLQVFVDGHLEGTIVLNRNTDGWGSNNGGFSEFTLEGLEIANGANVEIRAYKDSGEWVRVDKVAFEQVKDPEPTWTFDPNTCTYTIEAEHLDLHNFQTVHGAHASGGELVKITNHDGKLSTEFGGETGVYNLKIHAQDENDGVSKLMVYVDGEFQGTIMLDQQTDGHGSNDGGFSEFTLLGLEIPVGAHVEIKAWKNCGEWVRIDKVAFEQVKFEVCDDPDAVLIDFEGFTAGDVLTTNIDGVTISATGGAHQAMIFDSQNPTGGDDDLETQVAQQGNVLIVSEDGDSSDPDDAVGGTITFNFDEPSMVFDLKVIDTEEGGTITLTLADGSTQTVEIPEIVNGGIAQVMIMADDVVQMEVQLDGSGAIDDICIVPGEPAPQVGSLSGTYFFDADRDGLDNDGANGINGVTVNLLDENGNNVLDVNGDPVVDTTGTDGTYSFGDLPAGTYGVKFTDTATGRGLTIQDANGNANDDIDSDASDLGGGMSSITGIAVVAGQDTPNNDAGVVDLPGAISGTYFCDDDDDGVDDGAPVDPDVAGKVVQLFQADGVTPAVDINGTVVPSTTTNAQGNYSFSNLAAGAYVVMFASSAAEGKEFIAPNQGGDPANDSDVVDLVNGKTGVINVVAGEVTTDVDAGVGPINEGPTAVDDQTIICVGKVKVVDLLFNDTDPENDSLAVTSISDADETAGVGESITLESGAVVILNPNGSVTIVAIDALPDLEVGDSFVDQFEYVVSDGGSSDVGNVDVALLGDLNTIDTITADLDDVGTVRFTLDEDLTSGGIQYTQNLVDVEFPNTHLGQVLENIGVFGTAYCLSILTPIDTAPNEYDFDISVLNADTYTAASAGSVQPPIADLGFNPQNIDNVNWLINEADDLIANGFTEGAIQRAIWQLVDGGADNAFTSNPINNFFANDVRYAGEGAAAQDLVDQALANDGFVAGEGDTVALILDPVVDGVQPFVIGVEFDLLAKECSVDDFMF